MAVAAAAAVLLEQPRVVSALGCRSRKEEQARLCARLIAPCHMGSLPRGDAQPRGLTQETPDSPNIQTGAGPGAPSRRPGRPGRRSELDDCLYCVQCWETGPVGTAALTEQSRLPLQAPGVTGPRGHRHT